MKAYCLIRSQPWYRREAFTTGLRMAGLEVKTGQPDRIDRDTVVLMWNRYAENHQIAERVEQGGGTVLVAENGYVGRGGTTPKFDVHGGVEQGHYYALAIGGHNGSGRWKQGGPERFEALGVDLKPWRTGGEYILVCPSRNFGRPDMLMPTFWADQTIRALRKFTKLPIRVRDHPGNNEPKRPLAEDLKGAAAVVVWASSAGVHALIEGIPVLCGAPHWICKDAAFDKADAFREDLASPWMQMGFADCRRRAFERMAWAQWTVEEIASGEPFRYLLSDAR